MFGRSKKPFRWWMWTKMAISFGVIVYGGHLLVKNVQPTEEELRAKYSPELRKRSLEGKDQREREFDYFVTKLKEQSKSDTPIWVIQAEERKREARELRQSRKGLARELLTRQSEMRREAGLPQR